MKTTSRVVLGALTITLMTYGSAIAQDAPAQPPRAPAPSAQQPALPPPSSAPASQAQSQTASGELVAVDVKATEVTLKTTTGEMKFKYDDTTKISGGKGPAGLATMTGSQAVIAYKKDGASNLATSIDVKPAQKP